MMTIKDMTARIAMAVMALMAWMPCAMAQEASAPAIGISVKPVTPTKGSSFTVAVTLSNDVPVYGLQLTVTLPDGLEMQTIQPGISVTDRTDGFAVTANGGKIVLYADDNKKVIAEGEGAVLTLPVSVVDGFEGGSIGINGALASVAGTAGGYVAVSVKDVTAPIPVLPTSITISGAPESGTIDVGKSLALTATLAPEYATETALTWSSNNESVAKVGADGTVTAVAPGDVAITATAGSVSASCSLTVLLPAIGVTLDRTELALTYGDSPVKLTATVDPVNSTDALVWSSSDKSVVTVEADGTVTIAGVGTATVTATAGSVSASCVVTVNPVIEFDDTGGLSLDAGGNLDLKKRVRVSPETDNIAIVRKSSKPDWLKMSDEGVLTLAEGAVTSDVSVDVDITAYGYTVSKSLTVKVKATTDIAVAPEVLTLGTGFGKQLKATLTPAASADKVGWSSNNAEVATVDAAGLVTAVAEGTATVTATAGGVSATCEVTVMQTKITIGVAGEGNLAALAIGETVKLDITVSPEPDPMPEIGWISSDAAVAEVDQEGNVTAIGPGTATITATLGAHSKVVEVTVKEDPKLTLDRAELTVAVGGTATLTASLTPADFSDEIIWSSSKPEVATVDQEGNVTAVAPGTATITATAKNYSELTASCTVTVPAVPATGVTLDRTELALTYGDSPVKLTATVDPANSTDALVWRSSNESVVTVDYDGTVTIVGVGTATITATAGSVSASCEVTVKALITLKGPDAALEIGEEYKCELTISPQPAAGTAIVWSSSNPEVAGVDQEGNVTAVGPGTATITVTVGTQSVSVTVTVNEPPTYPATGVTLDRTELVLTYGDSPVTLTATVEPVYSTDVLVWRSSDESVVTVDYNGTVTIAGVGMAIVTATAGSASASCAVEVKALITLKGPAAALEIGDKSRCELTISPQPADGTAIVWISSDAEVAEVDQEGNVTAVAPGTATITVTVGTRSVSVTVTVNEPPTYPATGVTLDRTALALTYGDSPVKLTATVDPANSTDALVWRSSDENVVTVDTDGTVTIAGVGTATITATAGSASASCAVEVKALITLKGPAAALEIGDKSRCELTISPQPSDGTAIVWISSDTEVAEVDQEGNVTAVAPGTATITVTVGTRSVSVTVTVNEPPTGINGVEAVGERGDLYNLRGDIVAREVIISELSSLPRGVYIFKTATRSVKIRL